MPLNHDWVHVRRRLERQPGDPVWELRLACEAARIRVRQAAAQLRRELARSQELSSWLKQNHPDLWPAFHEAQRDKPDPDCGSSPSH
ncbi:MAG: hypothetical protein JWN24_2945 [Phycisphaerales bacterium]|nr:hypothetical protein [Phycisphaerales bacterium]